MCQHRCLISFLLLSYKDFATMVTWHHTSPLYNGLAIWQQMTYTVLNLLFHWSPLICTSIVFRDRGIVMSQSLLFSQLITVFQIGADHPATVPQHPKTLKLLSSPTGFFTSVCLFILSGAPVTACIKLWNDQETAAQALILLAAQQN